MIGKERHKVERPRRSVYKEFCGPCRKEVRTFLKQFSRVTAYTGGDDVRKAEANTKGSKVHYSKAYADIKRKARTRRACRGQRAWQEEREKSGNWEPLMFPEHAGRAFQQNEESLKGVRESDRFIVL